MKNLNGFQLHQQIKAIAPTIKILFITGLDILLIIKDNSWNIKK